MSPATVSMGSFFITSMLSELDTSSGESATSNTGDMELVVSGRNWCSGVEAIASGS